MNSAHNQGKLFDCDSLQNPAFSKNEKIGLIVSVITFVAGAAIVSLGLLGHGGVISIATPGCTVSYIVGGSLMAGATIGIFRVYVQSNEKTEKAVAAVYPVDEEAVQGNEKKEEDVAPPNEVAVELYPEESSLLVEADFQGPIGDWLREHHNQFVAHAIWTPEGIQGVLEDGQVKPAEMRFRESGQAEYEVYTIDNRQVIDISQQLPAILERTRTLPIHYKFTTDEYPNYPFEFDVEQYLQKKKEIKEAWKMLDKGEGALTTRDVKKLAEKNKIPTLKVDHKVHIGEHCCTILKEFPALRGAEFHIQMLRDQALPEEQRIDVLLSHHYKNLIAIGKSPKKAISACISIRDSIIWPNSLNPEVRTCANAVSWSYGDVAILKGNADTLSVSGKHGREVILQQPFQNGGKFSTIELADEDVVVIGPRQVLEPYRSKGYKMVYIDELSDRQKWFFRVPESVINQ